MPDRLKLSFVIFDILALSPECQSARMLKTTNSGRQRINSSIKQPLKTSALAAAAATVRTRTTAVHVEHDHLPIFSERTPSRLHRLELTWVLTNRTTNVPPSYH